MVRIRLTALVLLIMIIDWSIARRNIPPPPRRHGYKRLLELASLHTLDYVVQDLDNWTKKNKENLWELTGLLEGDIMEDYVDSFPTLGRSRNVLRDQKLLWPNASVPYFIGQEYEQDEINMIEDTVAAFEKISCIKFRPYDLKDEEWIEFSANSPGCWSYIGRQEGGQIINLSQECLDFGTIAHEILHALGFHHQQSASNRDDYVSIHWNNIRRGMEKNFKKYEGNTVHDLQEGYDYNSIMHFSTHAFTKNLLPTITPKADLLVEQLNDVIRQLKMDHDKIPLLYLHPSLQRMRKISRFLVRPFVESPIQVVAPKDISELE